ncbi:MAG: RNA polymerase sigma factor [Wujia sp.]
MDNTIYGGITSYTQAIQLALQGIEEGFTYLYQKTYYDKYYIALKYMKNEQDAQDVLQDAYVRAWGRLGSIEEPEKFQGWMSRIVANTALNALAKKNPILFSELEREDESGETVQYDIQDDNNYIQPELAYTVQETQVMVHELLESLSDDQRMCILMFHIEGQSIKDIAETLGCSENTVKSRLNYGRNNLRSKCEELKKQGYQLYSVAPLPLLVYLVRAEAAAYGAMSVAAGTICSNITATMPGTAAGKGLGEAAMGTAAEKGLGEVAMGEATSKGTGGFLATVTGKILVGIAGLAVTAGIVLGAVLLRNKAASDDEDSMNSSELTTEQAVATTESTEQEGISTAVNSEESTEDTTVDTTEEITTEQTPAVELSDISYLYGYEYSIIMDPVQSSSTSYGENDVPNNTRYYDVIDGGDGYYVTCTLEYKECATNDVASCTVGDSFHTTLNKTYTVVRQEVHGNARVALYLEDEQGEEYVINDTLGAASNFDTYTKKGYCPIIKDGEVVVSRLEDVVIFVPYETPLEDFLSFVATGQPTSDYVACVIYFDADGNIVFLADMSAS